MKEETQVMRQEPTIMEIVQQIVASPNAKEQVEVMRELLAMKERQEDREAKREFMDALAGLQAKLPQIDKDGQAKNSKFARLESIDIILRPLLEEFGFSVSFNEEAFVDKNVTFAMTLSHRSGHSETKRLTVPVDVAAKNREGVSIRPAIQDAGSTVSYARRYLMKMHLNLIERGEDTDGEPRKPITGEQEKQLRDQVEAAGMNLDKFLVYMRVGKLSEILAGDWEKAQTVIRAAVAEKKK